MFVVVFSFLLFWLTSCLDECRVANKQQTNKCCPSQGLNLKIDWPISLFKRSFPTTCMHGSAAAAIHWRSREKQVTTFTPPHGSEDMRRPNCFLSPNGNRNPVTLEELKEARQESIINGKLTRDKDNNLNLPLVFMLWSTRTHTYLPFFRVNLDLILTMSTPSSLCVLCPRTINHVRTTSARTG